MYRRLSYVVPLSLSILCLIILAIRGTYFFFFYKKLKNVRREYDRLNVYTNNRSLVLRVAGSNFDFWDGSSSPGKLSVFFVSHILYTFHFLFCASVFCSDAALYVYAYLRNCTASHNSWPTCAGTGFMYISPSKPVACAVGHVCVPCV